MTLAADVSYAVRSLRRRPGFTAVALLTIAIAIAANTTMFSVVYGTLIRALPYRNPGSLVIVDSRAHTGQLVSTSMPNYRDWASQNRVFSSVAASAPWRFILRGSGDPRIVESRVVVGDFFGTLGLSVARGRVITASEAPAHDGGARVAVVGNRFWTSQLGGNPNVVGSQLDLDGTPFTIVGVLPANIGFPAPDIDVYLPVASVPGIPWDSRTSGFGATAFARLSPSVSVEAARADLSRLGAQLRATYGQAISVPEVRALSDATFGDVRQRLWLLMAAVTFVLLIAVTNVGNLMLAAGEQRHRELAVRAALGAERRDILRLLLAESLIIGVCGGALGVAMAFVGVGAILPLLPADVPAIALARIRVDTVVAAWGLALAVATSVLFGLGPGWRMASGHHFAALKSGTRAVGGAGRRVREMLVVSEMALAVVLLVASGLMMRSLTQLLSVDKGFSAEQVVMGGFTPSASRVATREQWLVFNHDVLDRVRSLPGVQSAALSLLVPLSHRSWELLVHPEGVPVRDETGKSVLFNVVSRDYFATLGVPLTRGRAFTAADRDGAEPVVVIDETMAAEFWPNQSPLGKRITFERDSSGVPIYRTVVGVARNVRHYELTSPSRVQVYEPMEQSLSRTAVKWLIVRTAPGSTQTAAALRRMLHELDPQAPVFEPQPLQRNVEAATGDTTAMTRVLGAFALVALLLSAIGIFGVMSYTVARRTREIGLRMALGASPSEVTRWIVRRAARLTGIGLVVGIGAAVGFARLLQHVMFQVSPLDPPTFGIALVLLTVVSIAAALIPARRASRVDPTIALAQEE